MLRIKRKFISSIRAFGIHFGVSFLVATFAAILVFGVWYPKPYHQIQGGVELFRLIVGVDVVCGPLLTFFVYDTKKTIKELVVDLSVVGLMQVGALVYGLHSVWVARPVYLAFEFDRFRVVSLVDLDGLNFEGVPSGLPRPSWNGIQMVGVRVARPEDPDYVAQLKLSLSGEHAAYRPSRWIPYTDIRRQVLDRSRPISELQAKHPEAQYRIQKAVADTGRSAENLRWIPLQSRWSSDWTALLSTESAEVLGFVNVDGF